MEGRELGARVWFVSVERRLMSLLEIFLSGVVVLLACFLLVRIEQRSRQKLNSERQWPGHGMDVRPIIPRLSRLRADYLAEVRSHSPRTGYHRVLICSARRFVGRLPFFQRRTVETSHYEGKTAFEA